MHDITTLKAALLVQEHLGFRRASDVLGVNPSMLSRRIGGLEDALGVSLFQRQAGGARATCAGARFLEAVQHALDLIDHAAAHAGEAGRGQVGRIRLGHHWPITMGPAGGVLSALRLAANRIELELREASAPALITAILEGDLDMALVEFDDATPALDHLVLWSEGWRLATSSSLGSPGTPCCETLAAAPFLCCSIDDWARIQRAVLALGGPPLDVRVQRTSREGLMGLVAAGAGNAIVPASLAAAPSAGVTYSHLPPGGPVLRMTAVWQASNDNPALRRFISELRRSATAAPHPIAAE